MLGLLAGRVGEDLDLVEIDVGEAVPLLLVKADARPFPLGGDRLFRDRLLEGRELAPVVGLEHEPRVPGLRRERLHAFDQKILFGHTHVLPASSPRKPAAHAAWLARASPSSTSLSASSSACGTGGRVSIRKAAMTAATSVIPAST